MCGKSTQINAVMRWYRQTPPGARQSKQAGRLIPYLRVCRIDKWLPLQRNLQNRIRLIVCHNLVYEKITMKIFKKISHISKYLAPTIPFICFFLGYALSNLLVGNKTYKTPELIGLSLHQAIEKTSPYQITIQLVAEKECPGAPQGTIISQKPSPGRSIKSHQSILVVTTKLPPAAKAPSVLGKTQDQVEKIQKSEHIKLKTYSLNYPAPKGVCIGQIPQPGQSIIDKKMTLYTTKEKQNKYIMPTLIDKNAAEVVEFLKSHSLVHLLK